MLPAIPDFAASQMLYLLQSLSCKEIAKFTKQATGLQALARAQLSYLFQASFAAQMEIDIPKSVSSAPHTVTCETSPRFIG